MSTYVAVFALVLAYVALVAAYCALRTLARLRRATALLSRGTRTGGGRESLIEATTRHAELTASVAAELEQLRGYVDAALDRTRQDTLAVVEAGESDTAGALRNVALVRYDAFPGMSGRLSFSLALLDEQGNGVTLSALAGPTDTRVYAKGVALGKGEQELSPEELQAVGAAGAKPRAGLLHRKAG